MRSVLLLVLGSVLLLASCSDEPENDPPAAETAQSTAPAQESVNRAEASPSAATPAPAPVAAIQTQAGPGGTQVSLVRAQVTGDVLTVQLSYQPADESYDSHDLQLEQVSVIDDTTAQRYGVLRDAQNRWQASPIPSNNADVARVLVNDGRPSVAWFKFPAPPATSRTVSINIPEVGPFDGVTVQR